MNHGSVRHGLNSKNLDIGLVMLSAPVAIHAVPAVGEVVPRIVRELAALIQTSAVTIMHEQTASNPANRIGLLHLSEPLLVPMPFPRVGEVVPQWLRNLAAISPAHAVTILWEDPRHCRRPDHRFYHDMAFYQMPDGEWLTFNLGSGRRTRDFNITWRQDPGVGFMEGLWSVDIKAAIRGGSRALHRSSNVKEMQDLQTLANREATGSSQGAVFQASSSRPLPYTRPQR
ncbi:MAG: hypothetical protein Q9197_005913 [Variospora fuerteventurae]